MSRLLVTNVEGLWNILYIRHPLCAVAFTPGGELEVLNFKLNFQS